MNFPIESLTRRLLVATLAACAIAPVESNAQSGPVKIGVIMPTKSVMGQKGQQGADMAAEMINEQGGILGGRKIQLISYDMLDEPAAGLNHTEGMRLAGVLKRLQSRGCTTAIIDHNLPLLMSICDRMVVLQHGRKIADDVPAAIVAHPEVLSAYLGTSAENEADTEAVVCICTTGEQTA